MRSLHAPWPRAARWLLSVVALVSPGGVQAAAPGVWTSGGPYGAFVNVLAVDPSAPSTLYAGTYGGVFKSTDGGGTWRSAGKGVTNDSCAPCSSIRRPPPTCTPEPKTASSSPPTAATPGRPRARSSPASTSGPSPSTPRRPPRFMPGRERPVCSSRPTRAPPGIRPTPVSRCRSCSLWPSIVWYLDHAGNRTGGVFTSPDAPASPLDWTLVGPR